MQCRAAQAKTCYFHDAQTQLHPMTWQRPSGEYGGNLDTAVVVADLLRPKVLTTALAIFFVSLPFCVAFSVQLSRPDSAGCDRHDALLEVPERY